MNESVRIDCEICADLLPLVEDGVACGQSRRVVLEHAKSCEMCREKYAELLNGERADSNPAQERDDARIVGRARERVSGWLLSMSWLCSARTGKARRCIPGGLRRRRSGDKKNALRGRRKGHLRGAMFYFAGE